MFEWKKILDLRNQTEQETELWNKYRLEALESFSKDNPNKRFNLSKVEELCVDYDVLFLNSEKDIGKNIQIAKKLEKIKAKDPDAQICFVRNSKEEVKVFVDAMNNFPLWPCLSDGKYVWWRKSFKSNEINKKEKPCGFITYVSEGKLSFDKWMEEGLWNKLRFWIWDDCNSVEGGLTYEVFKSVVILLCSLNKNKSESNKLVGYMIGNPLKKKNVFLDFLGVNRHTNLKIVEIHEDQDTKKSVLSKLLYLNNGNLFAGIENQNKEFLTLDKDMKLIHKVLGFQGIKSQYEEIDLKDYKYEFCFVFSGIEKTSNGINKRNYYVCSVYRILNSNRVVCLIKPYVSGIVKLPKGAICFECSVANEFGIAMLEDEDFADYIEFLQGCMERGEVWFVQNETQKIFEHFWPIWKERFIKKDENEK